MLRHGFAMGVWLLAAAVIFIASDSESTSPALPTTAREVRVLELDSMRESYPFCITFSSTARGFVLVPVDVADGNGSAVVSSTTLDFFGNPLRELPSPSILADSVNVTSDRERHVLYYVSYATNQLMEIALMDGIPTGPGRVVGVSPGDLGIHDARGITFDSRKRHLYILDRGGRQIVTVDLQSSQGGSGPRVLQKSDIGPTEIAPGEPIDLRGIAFDPATDRIYAMRSDGQVLYLLNLDGTISSNLDLSSVGLAYPQSMLFAPSGDLTDDESHMSLYVVDGDPNEQWRIVELAFTGLRPSRSINLSLEAVLVQVIDTSQFDPPSPDTAGAAYLSDVDRLLLSDSEVNEMPMYKDVNVFEILRSGELTGGFNTLDFSGEPTGVAYKPDGQRLFLTDDNNDAVYEVRRGADEMYGTADDIVTSFSTRPFGSYDPEGITYEGVNNRLFLVDGVNAEVYEISPGPNGIFDGVDDHVEHFDTEALGILDPEGIEFNPDTGTLYVVGKPEETVMEVNLAGEPVQYIDISEPDPRKPAGLAYGPRSNDPSVMSLYVVERGVDNDSDPEENDGKVYEFGLDIPASTPTITPTPPNTPTATATATSTPVTVTPTPTRAVSFNHVMYLVFTPGGTP